MGKIGAVYKIVNTVTGEFYIGSSRNVMDRWAHHKCPSTWKAKPNSKMYQDMQEYGVDKFLFQILTPVMPEYLKQVEQEFIELLKPTYNQMNAKGLDIERYKASYKKYNHLERVRASNKKYYQSDEGKSAKKKYKNQLCEYNGETLTLNALSQRFAYAGIPHPTLEAKKYLTNNK